MSTHQDRKAREAVGVYVDSKSLAQAAKALVAAGFHPESVSFMSSVHTVRTHLHHLFEDSIDDSAVDFISRANDEDTAHGLSGGLVFAGHSAAAGALVVTAAAIGNPVLIAIAAAAAVGSVGATAETLISQNDTEHLQEQVNLGHLLLFARWDGAEAAQKAQDILRRDSLSARLIEFSPEDW